MIFAIDNAKMPKAVI